MPKKITEKNKDEKIESVTPEPKTPEAKAPEPKAEAKAPTQAQVQQRVKSKAEQMESHLKSQAQITILIPLEKGEKKGAVQPFCINGYRFDVPKGVMTAVPEQVAQMISERFAVELDVRNRAIGNKPDVKNALE